MTNDLRVVKTGACASLSGKTKLTYELACGPAADLHMPCVRARMVRASGPRSDRFVDGPDSRPPARRMKQVMGYRSHGTATA